MKNGATNKAMRKKEFGDWQTPADLAMRICALVAKRFQPQIIFEPNCGKGAFLRACVDVFPGAANFWGLEINADYVRAARKIKHDNLNISHEDFFECNWHECIRNANEPILIIGNPPWATNSALMRLQSQNLPQKHNFDGVNGIDAITGKSNFDIAEWMLIREIEALQGKNAVLAMICKTATARKVILTAWKRDLCFAKTEIREVDAKRYFSVAADAGLLLMHFSAEPGAPNTTCDVYASLEDNSPQYTLGKRNGRLVSNTDIIDRHVGLISAKRSDFVWRSGIKHDCAKVMELDIQDNGTLLNGYEEVVDIESDLLFPMLKSSDLANDRLGTISKMMVVPQKSVGENTKHIESIYPKAWEYLQYHAKDLTSRKSAIYKKRPSFSIFGVGRYTFARWKVAISGLYKTPAFRLIGPYRNKPVVFDDTCYFLACKNEQEATLIKDIMDSQTCSEILNSFIFTDSKRPITRDVLSVIDIAALAKHLGVFERLAKVCPQMPLAKQSMLF